MYINKMQLTVPLYLRDSELNVLEFRQLLNGHLGC